jgi:hypothetical protein
LLFLKFCKRFSEFVNREVVVVEVDDEVLLPFDPFLLLAVTAVLLGTVEERLILAKAAKPIGFADEDEETLERNELFETEAFGSTLLNGCIRRESE